MLAEVDHIDLEDGDHIVSFDYLMEKEALLLGTYNGQMLLHSVDDKLTEIVGQVEGGVRYISPSPDGDLLCIITGFEQMLVMTHDWDLLYETSLRDLPDGIDVRKDLFLWTFFFYSWIFKLFLQCSFVNLSNVFNYLIGFFSPLLIDVFKMLQSK